MSRRGRSELGENVGVGGRWKKRKTKTKAFECCSVTRQGGADENAHTAVELWGL